MNSVDFTPFGGTGIGTDDLNSARIIVLPIFYENASSYGTGSREGSYHLLTASQQLESLDEETLVDWSLLKIHTLNPLVPAADPKQAVLEMEKAAENILTQNKFLLSLGGDHAISIGPISAASKMHPDIGILQIDAHLDLRNEWNGSRYNHACTMRRVADMNLPVVQVGIRSFSQEEANFAREKGFKPFYAHRIDPFDNSWVEQAVDMLPEKVYITIDLDGLDPSVIPGTGTPEPGGISYRQLVTLIKTVGQKRKVIAADISELAKIEGSQTSEATAAKIATKLMVYCAAQ
jgi:agmatinase